ncbi:LysR family transcriptional regulator [Parahaliea mediterranea]|uniref:LysR family transcriptional regulator n=1 Tax=Parahaliea mediterranea TaxID=651086 RepID=A0A939DEZ0_9GAMM|nr:LysR family transcriptional regulator [Parahaliea mediterranea]MBN7796297.1 LysR family transcriptional regulator [Parahaliea mediterranea]
MDSRQLHKIDLNLLVALQALLEERNVSRAAQRLHITQPAMSKTLSRLRELFGDTLFTRSNRGMQPTPRARELEQALPAILADIGRLVSGSDFDPWAYTGEVVLALSEYVGMALLPPLIQRLHEQAPRLSIRTITRVENQLEQLAAGNLDFAIHIAQAHYADEFQVHAIGGSPPAVLVRRDHPLTHGEVTWERLANYPVIRVYISDLDQAELVRSSDTFNRVRHPQQGSLETSHLMTALEVLRNTDYFLPGPAYMLRNEAAAEGIVALPMPEDGDYSMEYMLVMHERCAGSPLHQWLWRQIIATLESLERAA